MLAQFLGERLSRATTSAEASVALLLVVPSVMSAFLARETEHELVSELLRIPRFSVACSAGAAIAAGGGMVLQISGWRLGLIWAIAAAVGLVVFALLTRIGHVSSAAFRETSDISTFTYKDTFPV
jgi:hypothetical protein